MKQATIKDVAEAARCSTTLVSRVMNAPRKPDGTPDCVVNPKTAERIFEAVKTLGYRPNKAAVSLRKKLRKRIGVILPDLSNQFFAGIAKQFEMIARQNGYTVLFGSSNDNNDLLYQTAQTFIEDGVDGIILTPGADCENQIRSLTNYGFPLVLIIRDIPEIDNIGKILLDSADATTSILDHLIQNGFRHIDMLSKELRLSIVKEREDLYVEYMKSHGMEHKIYHASESESDIEIILERARRQGTDAIYCISAALPVRCIASSKSKGIRIPDDIALCGYDGGRLYDALSPTITQIEYSHEEIAHEAFRMLMKMASQQEFVPEKRYLKGKLVIGESTTRIRTGSESRKQESAKDEILAAIDSLRKALNELK